MTIPFVKAHGAGNDFLLTWRHEAPRQDLPEFARRLCSRHTGVGADGWYLLAPARADCDAAATLYNSDGSAAELSGNGTRCVAALLVETGMAASELRIATGAGLRRLRLLSREGLRFRFEMEMGQPSFSEDRIRFPLPLSDGPCEVTILDVGNPQCAVFVDGFSPDWNSKAAEIEAHPLFPKRTNVSFVRLVDEHTIEARFFERGAGETLSSGTGSVGAAVAAVLRGLVKSPIRMLTPAGPMELRWDEQVFLVGPAEIIARGDYFC